MGSLIEDLKKVWKELQPKEKSEFMAQLLKEKDVYDKFKSLGLSLTSADVRERARLALGVLTLVEKVTQVDVIKEIAGIVNINIASSAVTLSVQSAVGKHVDIDIISSIQLNVNIAQSDITVNVHETGTANVSITSSIALDINIIGSAITLNVQTAVGEHIDVDITSAITLNINIASSDITVNVHETGTAQVDITSSIQLNVNLAGSAITVDVHETGTANVSITSSIALNMNITGSTIDVPITNPTGENLNVNIASSITVNMSITGATINVPIETAEGKKVDVNIISTITLNVNIESQTANVNVNINAQAVDLNIKTSGGVNILIDLLEQGAYIERRSTIANRGTTALWGNMIGDNRASKFFTRGCMGFINKIEVYCKSVGVAGTITVYISPNPSLGYVDSVNITVGAGAEASWRTATFNRMWLSDKLFIFIVCSHADIKYGYDAEDHTKNDAYNSTDAGATWIHADNRTWILVVMKGETVGDLNVAGTVNNIEIPHSSSGFEGMITPLPAESEIDLVTINGCGYIDLIEANVSASANSEKVWIKIYCDGNLVFNKAFESLSIRGYTPTTFPVALMNYAVNGVCNVDIMKKFEFQREFRLAFEEKLGDAQNVSCWLYSNLTK